MALYVHRQRGQSMVLFLGFAAAMMGMMLVAFNSGQVTNAKMRAMNAADAAAYSGALWQARNLNFQAYMNRAMVVNEVTIAQSVSLRSWVGYLDKLVSNISMITNFIPPVAVEVRAVQQVLSRVDQTMQRVVPPAELALRGLTNAEHAAQVAFDGLAPLAAQELAFNVAQQNGAAVSTGGKALVALNLRDWAGFTRNYSPGRRNMGNRDERARLREVTLNSRDGFVQERDWKFGLKPLFEIRKQGGTDLIDYDAWKGLDSMELRTTYNYFKGKWMTKTPVAWGGAQAYGNGRANGIGVHGNTNEWNDGDGQLARSAANSSTYAKNARLRFPGYRDLEAPQLQKDDPRLPFAIEVVVAGANIATARSAGRAQTALFNGAVLEQDPQYQGRDAGVYALAEACVAFERPVARQDGAQEKAGLFNPYWHAFMATDSRGARITADTAKGLPSINALLGGSGTCVSK